MSATPPSPTSIPSNVNVEQIAAPQLLGGLGNWFLFGILVVQVYVYSYNFPEDRKQIKLMVFGVFFLETLQTALNGADLYYWFASGFGRIGHLTSPYATPFDVPMIGTLVSFTVQCFFMYRILVLSRKQAWWLCVLILLFSIVSAIGAFSAGVYVSFLRSTSQRSHVQLQQTHIHKKYATGRMLKMLVLTWITGNTISDLLIASAMVFYLVRRRTRSTEDYASSHALVSIVRLTVETNIATTTVSVASLVMVSLYPDKDWFTLPTSMFGKIYSNTLLVSLNNRISIREKSLAFSGERNIRCPTESFPSNPYPRRSEATTGISLTDTHSAPDTFKIPPLEA